MGRGKAAASINGDVSWNKRNWFVSFIVGKLEPWKSSRKCGGSRGKYLLPARYVFVMSINVVCNIEGLTSRIPVSEIKRTTKDKETIHPPS